MDLLQCPGDQFAIEIQTPQKLQRLICSMPRTKIVHKQDLNLAYSVILCETSLIILHAKVAENKDSQIIANW